MSSWTHNRRRVAELTAQGKNSGQIADELKLSLVAVQRHIREVYKELGVMTDNDRVEQLREYLKR